MSCVGSMILLLCVLIVFLLLGQVDYKELNSIGQNWKNGPLESISVSDNARCPANSNYILDSKFSGSLPGCYCNSTGNISVGSCASQYLNCTEVKPIAPVGYKGWGERNLCGKRINENYFQLYDYVNSTGCTNNTKMCGFLDSLGNRLCLPKNDTCPINQIKIIPIREAVPGNFHYEVRNLPQINKKLIYTNQNTNGVIVDQLKVSDGTPCADPSEYNLNPNFYTLDPRAEKSSCKEKIANMTYNRGYVLLDSIPYSDLLRENGLTNLIHKLPQYPKEYLNHKVNLYYRPYIGLNQTCMNLAKVLYPGENQILNLYLFSHNELSDTSVNPLASPILGFLIFLFIFIAIIFKLTLYSENSKTMNYVFRVYANATIAFFTFLLFIAGLFDCLKISSARNIYIWINKDPTCTDKLTYGLIKNFDCVLDGAYFFSVLFTILALILTILPLLEYLLKRCGESREKGDNYEEIYGGEGTTNN